MILSKQKIARKVFVSVYSCCGLVHCAYTIHIIIIVHWEYIFFKIWNLSYKKILAEVTGCHRLKLENGHTYMYNICKAKETAIC